VNPALIAALVTSVAFGAITGKMARNRGRSFWLWGLFGSVSFVIAMIALAIAGRAAGSSPDQRKAERAQSKLPANNIELFAQEEKLRKQRAHPSR
jgi:hypothetical protein